MNVQLLCEKCSDIVSLSSPYISECKNSDQIVCVEACSKMCHALLFCTVCGMLDQIILTKLHEVCEWCKNICERLQINSKTECCQNFLGSCQAVCDMCKPYSKPFSSHGLNSASLPYLGECCKEMLQSGMINKPLCLMNNTLDNQGLAKAEACLKLCCCVECLCCNATELLCPGLISLFDKLCQECTQLGFCSESAQKCVDACNRCM